MALSKTLPTEYGSTVDYHKVAEIIIDWHNRQATVTLMSFVSEQAREAGAQPLAFRGYSFSERETAFPFTVEGPNVQQAYEWIKANDPEFADATDILEPGQTV